MKYCVPYYKTFKYMEEVDEVIVPFATTDIGFIKSLTSKEKMLHGTVIIEIKDMYDFNEKNSIGIFKDLQLNYPEVKFKLMFERHSNALDTLYQGMKEHNIPFFFATFVRDWDTFNGFIDLGVSDIYIVEELAFSLGKLGPIAHAKNISIRCFANVAQSRWVNERSIKSFFIRPEDVYMYESYIDVLEFQGESQNIQEIMYDVYAHAKKWFGPLREIIFGLESDIDSRTILPDSFAKVRLNCDHKCKKGGKCTICNRFEDVSDTLLEHDVYFKY